MGDYQNFVSNFDSTFIISFHVLGQVDYCTLAFKFLM